MVQRDVRHGARPTGSATLATMTPTAAQSLTLRPPSRTSLTDPRTLLVGRITLTLLLVASVWLADLRPAAACSCIEISVAEALDFSDVVFTGEALSVGLDPDDDRAVRAVFAVSRHFKGADVSEITLLTSTSSASCGYEFAVGESYLIFASDDDGTLRTTPCSRTRTLDQAGDDIAALDALIDGDGKPGNEDDEGGCATAPGSSPGSGGAIAMGLLVLALVSRRSVRRTSRAS